MRLTMFDRFTMAMKKMEASTNYLKDKDIRALEPKEKPYKMSDGGGMYLLVTPPGGKLWQMGYRFGGKQKTLSIGIYPDVSIKNAEDARDAARKLLAAGIDPHAAKKNYQAKRMRAALPSLPRHAEQRILAKAMKRLLEEQGLSIEKFMEQLK
jgi:hypothetical protein